MASARIYAQRTISGNQPVFDRRFEEASQTFLDGTPVQLNAADAGVQAWDGTTLTAGIAGFSAEAGHNLAATAQWATGSGFSNQNPAGVAIPGGVINQPLAFNLARPGVIDGKIGFYAAAADTVFFGEVGPSQTTANTDVGKSYGLTKDSDGHWFVDKTKTGASAAVIVQAIDTLVDITRGVWFTVIPTVAQVTA